MEWPRFAFDAANRGSNPDTWGPEGPIRTRWSRQISRYAEPSPAVVNKTVYVPGDGLYAIQSETGRVRWKADIQISGSVTTVADGTVFVASYGGLMNAVDARTGTIEWTSTVGMGKPAVVDGTVYFGTGESVVALDSETGSKQWQYQTGQPVPGKPAVADGVVYIGDNGGNVYALDAETGQVKWRFADGKGAFHPSPTVIDDRVFVGNYDYTFYALDRTDGSLDWTFDRSGSFGASASYADGTLYVGNDDGRLYGLVADSGRIKWKAGRLSGAIKASPAVVGSNIYYTGTDGTIACVAANDGEFNWRFDTPNQDQLVSSPAVVDGCVFVVGGDAKLYALEEETKGRP